MWVLLALSTGCRPHLVGLSDVALHYVVQEGTPSPETLRDVVTERLQAAELAADVEAETPGHVTVRVDQDSADESEALLGWPGGVAVAVVAPTFPERRARLAGKDRATIKRELFPSEAARQRRDVTQRSAEGAPLPLEVRWPPVLDVMTDAAVAAGTRVLVPLP